MIYNKFLMLGTISVLLATTVFGAGTQNCLGGVCMVNLDNLKPSKNFKPKQEVLKETSSFTGENIDNSMTIVLDGETITVFPHSSYVANEEEVMDFMLLAEPMKGTEARILAKTNLPASEYFCEKNKHVVYLNQDVYECV